MGLVYQRYSHAVRGFVLGDASFEKHPWPANIGLSH